MILKVEGSSPSTYQIKFFNFNRNNSSYQINFFSLNFKKYFLIIPYNFFYKDLNTILSFFFYYSFFKLNFFNQSFYSTFFISNKKHNSNFKLNYFSLNFSFFKSSKSFKKNFVNKFISEKSDLNLKTDLKTSKLFIIFFLKLINKNVLNTKFAETLVYSKNIFYEFFNFFYFLLKSCSNFLNLKFFFFKIISANNFFFKKKKSISKRLKKKYLSMNSRI